MSIHKFAFSDTGFEDQIGEGLSIVCFGDPNDPESRRQLKIIEAAASEIDGEIRFGLCAIEDCSALAARFRITSIPTMLVVRDGEEIERLAGFRHEFTLEKHLRKDVADA